MPSDERATGLVLRIRPLTETSLIVHWLTPALGRIATVAKGARRPNSAFRGKLDLFYRADFSFQRSRRSELHTLREVTLRETNAFLRLDVARLQQAAHAVALVEQNTETETPVESLHDLFGEWLVALAVAPASPAMVFAFELRLLEELGLAPDFTATGLSAGSREIVNRLAAAPWEMINRLKPGPGQVAELQRFLHNFMLQHLGRVPKGRATALGLNETPS
jgi:DNA repair protein RecO (recombination protein O)